MLRRIDSLLRRYAGIIILAVLGILAWNAGLLSIFAGETPIMWQGQEWKYSGTISPIIDDVTLKLSTGCSNGECKGYFRSDFDTSKYSEIRLLYSSLSSASVGRASSSASAFFNLKFGDAQIGGSSAGASSIGGAETWSKTVSSTGTFVIKNEGNSWGVYSNEIKIKTVSQANPMIYAELGANSPVGDGGSGSSSANINLDLKLKEVSLKPIASTLPAAPLLSSFVTTLKNWLSKLFDLVPFLTITGATSPVLGTSQTYSVSLPAATLADADYTDGTLSVRYCNVALMKSDGTIISEKGFETCTNMYATTYTATIPSQSGKYAVIAVMTESKGTFDTTTQAWAFTPYEIVAQEALNIETKAPIPGSALPLKPISSNVFANIWQWLFGWLF